MQPNLQEYTIDEAGDLAVKAMELEDQGKYEEARQVMMQVPLLPGIADNFKKDYGMDFLIEKQFNLSLAVKEFGYEWLNS